jgi:hypothetical protein
VRASRISGDFQLLRIVLSAQITPSRTAFLEEAREGPDASGLIWLAVDVLQFAPSVNGELASLRPVKGDAQLVDDLAAEIATTDGRALAYLEVGDASGPLVVHNHGGPSSRLEARLLADSAFKNGLRLVCGDEIFAIAAKELSAS